ncbi:unnamed protein product [Caenorhabditis bovis]|uniref:Kringle domain-containing protein n=1 Tax=Caenorhabditis bovis TaxID=2654633 RepID=A0A8S1EWX0_9PELO|nr:unnamed protein product [Caenorhabditis bovis]
MLISLLLLFIPYCYSILYNGKYFEIKDRINVECIRKNNLQEYKYLGNKNKTVSGQNCETWNTVTKSWFNSATVDAKKLASTTEHLYHSSCRNLKLEEGHPFFGKYSSGPDGAPSITSGKFGPWCYIIDNGKYTPAFCFEHCDESKIVVPHITRKIQTGYSYPKLNYNRMLLDPIDKLFKKYNFGDRKYYEFLPSKYVSPGYIRFRRNMFFGLCITVVVVIFWVSICYIMKKRSVALYRKRQKALEEFYSSTNIGDIRLRIEMEREANA